MTQTITVTLEVADFLLGRMIATAQINKELNEKVSELKSIIDAQLKIIKSYEHDNLLKTEINDLRSANRERAKK